MDKTKPNAVSWTQHSGTLSYGQDKGAHRIMDKTKPNTVAGTGQSLGACPSLVADRALRQHPHKRAEHFQGSRPCRSVLSEGAGERVRVLQQHAVSVGGVPVAHGVVLAHTSLPSTPTPTLCAPCAGSARASPGPAAPRSSRWRRPSSARCSPRCRWQRARSAGPMSCTRSGRGGRAEAASAVRRPGPTPAVCSRRGASTRSPSPACCPRAVRIG
eukprot:488-Chlamydomonas_euryale.AAC.2